MGKTNRAWHEAHRMPKNATEAQRAQWHHEHAQNCSCRAPTPAILALLAKHGYELPERAAT